MYTVASRDVAEGETRVEKSQTLPVDSTTDLSNHAPFVPAGHQHLSYALVGDEYERRARLIESLDNDTEYK